MCRIVGVAGTLSTTHKEVFDGLLYLQALNNADATGILTVNPSAGETSIMKAAIPAADMISAENYEDFRSSDNVLLLGHNRKATAGADPTADRLAHPFEEEHVIGVHNGTVRHWQQFTRGEDGYEIDSQALIKLINDADNVQEAVRLIHGAYALAWYDRRDHTLNMVRNSERPLVYGFTKDRKAFWTCSDPSLFMTARRYTRNMHMELDNGRDLLTETSPGVHYRIHLPDRKGKAFPVNAFEMTTLDLSKHTSKRRAGGHPRQQEFPSKNLAGYHGPKSPWPREKEQVKKTQGTPQPGEIASPSAIIRLKEDRAKEGREIINAYNKLVQGRFDNELYMDFLYQHAEYDITDKKKAPKAELDALNYWVKSMEKIRDETKAKVSEIRETIAKQGLDPEKAATICRTKYRLLLAEDLLGLYTGDFWDVYNPTPSEESSGSDDADSVSATGADYSEDIMHAVNEDTPECEKLPGKSQGGSGVPEDILREFDEIVYQSHCMVCGKQEKHPDIDKTIVIWEEGKTPYGPHETPIGIVCSSCASDPNIRAFAESGAYTKNARVS